MLSAPLVLLLAGRAGAAAVSDVRFLQDEQGLVRIRYRLEGPLPGRLEVGLRVSDDGGASFALVPTAVTGDVGEVSGAGEKAAVWDVAKDHPELSCRSCVVAVEAGPLPEPAQRLRRGMSLVPAGAFLMGSADDEGKANEHPRHEVRLGAFWLDRNLVTVSQFRAFCQATGRSLPPQPPWSRDDHPVVFVSWEEARAYCAWAGKRLPTEAQWEKAARQDASDDSEVALSSRAWFANDSGGRGHPVGQKRPNGLGLFDMGGNAAQWVADWYAEGYPAGPARDPQGPASGSMRVLRGGSFASPAAACRAASRDWFFPEGRAETNGLRCALSATAPASP